MTLSRNKIAFFLLVFGITPKTGLCVAVDATTLVIDPTTSVVHTTTWSNWPWGSGLPSDVVSFSVSGTFDLVIEEGRIDLLTDGKDPDTVQLRNIDVYPSNTSGRTWEFPSFTGKFESPDITASEDPCFLQNIPGSCRSIGNFGWYSGSFDGSTLSITGMKNPNLISDDNGFYYEITAVVIPLPSSAFLLLSGTPLLLLSRSRLFRNKVSTALNEVRAEISPVAG